MKVKQTTALGSVVASAAVAMSEAGFLPGMQVPVWLNAPAGSFVGSAIIQSSENGTTGWVTATGATAVTSSGSIQNITLQQFMRLNATAWTSGSIQASFLSGAD